MPTELADNATREEIQTFVDQAVKDVEEDRKADEPEEKTDSQRVAEEHDEPVTDTAAETDSGSDDTADEGEETGDSEDQAQDWLDDDLKAEVAAYGIDEKELADFTSREELERALRFFDRSALEAGRKVLAEGDEGESKTRDEQGKEPEPKSEPKEGQYEISLPNRGAYDEDLAQDLVGEFTRMRDHNESRFDALEVRFAEAEERAEEQHYDNLVDSLGHADLFGKTGRENSRQLQRRQDLHVAVKAQQIGLETLGRGVDLDRSLVNRVARMVFAEDLGKKDLKARTRKVSKQSDGRMGGGATRPSDPPETLMEEMERKYKELDDA